MVVVVEGSTMQKSVRYNESHALHLAALARKEGTKRGYLSKKTAETSRWHERWFALYQNLLFYCESEQSGRPAGLYLLEGCSCERAPAPKLGANASSSSSSGGGGGCGGSGGGGNKDAAAALLLDKQVAEGGRAAGERPGLGLGGDAPLALSLELKGGGVGGLRYTQAAERAPTQQPRFGLG